MLTDRQRALLAQRLADPGTEAPPDVPASDDIIPTVSRTRPIPLSSAQQRLWFLDRLAPDNSFYNVPMITPIEGRISVDALQAALDELVDRHQSLRTSFPTDGAGPVQRIATAATLPLAVVDVSNGDPEGIEQRARLVAENDAQTPFDLAVGPVVRATLVRLGPTRHWLVLTLHHIVTDGWSMGVLARELSEMYTAHMEGRPHGLAELPIQYADYAAWQQAMLQGPDLDDEIAYWAEQLADLEPLPLMSDRPRGPVTFAGDFLRFELAAGPTRALRELGAGEGATLYMTLLAAFDVLLHRLCAHDDIVVGSPIANRTRPELEPLIGFFVNTIVMRTDLSGRPTFREVLRRVRTTAVDAFAHQDVPFERLVDELRPERDADRNPLFQVGFVLQTAWTPERSDPSAVVSEAPPDIQRGTSIFDLAMHLWEQDDSIVGGIEYSTALFDGGSIERMLDQFTRLIEEVTLDADTSIDEIPILTEHERHRVTFGFNRTDSDTEPLPALPDLVAEHAVATPHQIAVQSDDAVYTYAQLDRRIDDLADRFAHQGVGPGARVATCLPRSLDAVAADLAVMRLGAAFVPLDPEYPIERLKFMAEDCDAELVVSRTGVVDAAPFGDIPLLWLDEPPASDDAPRPYRRAAISPGDVAYVIYTSGSSGVPKGVEVEHRGLSNVVAAQRDVLGVTSSDRILQFAPLSFDASVFEMAMALGLGATLHVADRSELYPGPGLSELLRQHDISVLTIPPSALGALPDVDLPALGLILVAGEECPAAHVDRWAPGRRMFNLYGPTETTIWATAQQCTAGAGRPSIGRPIPNVKVFIVDHLGQPVPIGTPGEICIGGAGVARGYVGRRDLTAERFVDAPTLGVSRLYRTGDRGRFLADGRIDFLGRDDEQVKVRGHRIELGEIESVLTEHRSIEEAVVIVREDDVDDRRLVAYVTMPDELADVDAAALSGEHVSYWQTLYDELYSSTADQHDPRFNIAGWEDSTTGAALPAGQMAEWVEVTVDRIRSLQPRQILELGCGSGLLLLRLAADVDRYGASDFSASGLDGLRREVERSGLDDRVAIEVGAADDATQVAATVDADVVVINSVIQYFPDSAYLRRSIATAIDALSGPGAVFVGDVRSRALLETFAVSVESGRAQPGDTAATVLERAQRRVALERELVVDPEFFHALSADIERIAGVEILVKRGAAHNELTTYRYDVILHVDEPPKNLDVGEPLEWHASLDVGGLVDMLTAQAPEALFVTGITNRRVAGDLAAREWLSSVDPATEVGVGPSADAGPAIDPEVLAAAAEALGYRVELYDSATAGAGTFDAMIWLDGGGRGRRVPRTGVTPARRRSWSHYTNSPWHGVFLRTVVPRLRSHLGDRLPDHLIPAHFVPLDRMPRTPAGKVDRDVLPSPERARPDLGVEFVAPTRPIEKTLAAIWAEALRVEHVGIHDNYFELGGDSILGIQIVSRAREAGIDMAPRDLFEYQTIADLVTHRARPIASESPKARPDSDERFALSGMSEHELASLVGQFSAGTGD